MPRARTPSEYHPFALSLSKGRPPRPRCPFALSLSKGPPPHTHRPFALSQSKGPPPTAHGRYPATAPHPVVGAIRDSDHPEALEGPSRRSGTLTPPPPAAPTAPRTPTVIPAKAGIQGRGEARGRAPKAQHPFALSQSKGRPPRPAHGRYPASATHPVVGAIRDSDHPEALEGPSRRSGTLTPPPPAAPTAPRTPTVIPAKAGIQGRGEEVGTAPTPPRLL